MYNINRRKFLGYFGCSCCSLILPSCSTVPITERKQLSIIPESRINRQAAAAYENFRSKYFDAKKIKEGISDSPIKNYARNNPDSGIPEFVNRNPQPRPGADLYTPPKTVNEDEIFGGMPKAPEGGMPFPGAPR